MVPGAMPPVRHLRPGYTVIFPNRDKAGSKATKLVVIVLLLVSAGLMLIVTLGGWSKLQGLKPVNVLWAILYVLFAIFIARWNRGLLPIAAAFAILLLILSLIAGLGASGTSWFDRNHTGYAGAEWLWGGKGLTPDTLGLVTLLIVPLQALLILFAMRGFTQGWNVEEEVPESEVKGRRGRPTSSSSPEPAAA